MFTLRAHHHTATKDPPTYFVEVTGLLAAVIALVFHLFRKGVSALLAFIIAAAIFARMMRQGLLAFMYAIELMIYS